MSKAMEMNQLRFLKGMDEQQRTRALESVINSEAAMYLMVESVEWMLAPVEKYRRYFSADSEGLDFGEVMDDMMYASGPLELQNGAEIAVDLVSMRGLDKRLPIAFRPMPIFLDHQRRPSWLVTFQHKNEDVNGRMGFLRVEVLDLKFDFLAVMPTNQPERQTRGHPLIDQMMNYLDTCNGKGNLRECRKFLLQNPDIDEGLEWALKYRPYERSEWRTVTWKTVRNHFNECKKTWKANS